MMLVLTQKQVLEENRMLFEQVSTWRTKVEELGKQIDSYKERAQTAERNVKYWSDQSATNWGKFSEMEDKYIRLKNRRRKK
jgi:hypothetical protein